jgi:hypothetical protein
METILLILTSFSFLIFWIETVMFYTPDCFNLRTMIDSIDRDGELTKTKASTSWYLTNFHTLDCWTISLPKTEKYLKYDIVNKTANRIRVSRMIMAYTAPMMIISGFILLMTVSV